MTSTIATRANQRLKIHIIAAALPPELDGIGDYSANLAAELAHCARVHILTGQAKPAPIANVPITTAFSIAHPGSVRGIAGCVAQNKPDWLLLQYNPFSYGKWGFNPQLPMTLRRLHKSGVRIAVMVHEPFMPSLDWKTGLMSRYQRWQLWMLGRNADVVFFSIEPWMKRFQSWFPRAQSQHLPVGSNLPREVADRDAERAKLGVTDETIVLGLFGTAHYGRMLERVGQAARGLARDGRDVRLLYIGPHGQAVRDSVQGVTLLDQGVLEAAEVSRRLAAVDIYLAPFVDGISTRRTTLMTGLQHGLPIVGTTGDLSDSMLLQQNQRAFLLAPADDAPAFENCVRRMADDATLRQQLGREASNLYEREFAWPCIARRMMNALENAPLRAKS